MTVKYLLFIFLFYWRYVVSVFGLLWASYWIESYQCLEVPHSVFDSVSVIGVPVLCDCSLVSDWSVWRYTTYAPITPQ